MSVPLCVCVQLPSDLLAARKSNSLNERFVPVTDSIKLVVRRMFDGSAPATHTPGCNSLPKVLHEKANTCLGIRPMDCALFFKMVGKCRLKAFGTSDRRAFLTEEIMVLHVRVFLAGERGLSEIRGLRVWLHANGCWTSICVNS